MRNLWTDDEDASVDWEWGERPLEDTANMVGRSVAAVRARLRSRGMSSAAMRGKMTIAALADKTGYTWAQVSRAIRGAKLRPVKTKRGKNGFTILTEEQCARIVEYLGEETRLVAEKTTIADVAELAGVARRTAWGYAEQLEIETVFGVLSEDDALVLYSSLRVACRPLAPPQSELTIGAVAEECGCCRAWAFRLASRPPRIRTGRGGELSEADAAELRRRLVG